MLLAIIVLAALTCDAPAVPAQDLKAAFIYVGPVGDAGWTFRHDQGRKCLEQQGIPTSFVESVPETPDVANIERDFLSQGASMIFAHTEIAPTSRAVPGVLGKSSRLTPTAVTTSAQTAQAPPAK